MENKIQRVYFRRNKKRTYSSGTEIGKKFGILHIWNVVKISELYQELKIPSYRERIKRH